MIFFLARSALCIGVVAAAASGVGTGPLATAIDRGGREAAGGVGRACLTSNDCLRAGTAALAAVAEGARASGVHRAEPPRRGPDAKSIRRAAPIGG